MSQACVRHLREIAPAVVRWCTAIQCPLLRKFFCTLRPTVDGRLATITKGPEADIRAVENGCSDLTATFESNLRPRLQADDRRRRSPPNARLFRSSISSLLAASFLALRTGPPLALIVRAWTSGPEADQERVRLQHETPMACPTKEVRRFTAGTQNSFTGQTSCLPVLV